MHQVCQGYDLSEFEITRLDHILKCFNILIFLKCGCHVHDCMVDGFTTTCAISGYITPKVVSSNPTHGEVHPMQQHYVIKFVSDLRQVGGFLWVLRFPPPIKLTTTI